MGPSKSVGLIVDGEVIVSVSVHLVQAGISEKGRQRKVQVGIREGLKTIEPELRKQKMLAVWLCLVYSDRKRNCSIS